MLCGTNGTAPFQAVLYLSRSTAQVHGAVSDACRDVSARKPVVTRRKNLCEPLDAHEQDGR